MLDSVQLVDVHASMLSNHSRSDAGYQSSVASSFSTTVSGCLLPRCPVVCLRLVSNFSIQRHVTFTSVRTNSGYSF